MTDEIIGRLLTDARRPALLSHLRKKLDRHPVLSKARSWAWVAPGNVPDPTALAVVSAGLKKSNLILKLSRQNEQTGRALVRALKKPGQKVRIVIDPRDLKKFSARADAWIVYGSDATIQTLRRHAPAAARVDHGHRISMSVVFRSALKSRFSSTVKNCARDIWLYDQRGCLSPQIIWVEGEAKEFVRLLQKELDRLRTRYGPIRRTPEMNRFRQRVLEELHIRSLNPHDLVLTSPRRTTSGGERLGGGRPVVYRLDRGRFGVIAFGQIVAVKSFRSLTQILRETKPFISYLQGVAVGGTRSERARIQKIFSRSSAAYFSPVGSLQSPPLDWQV